MSKKLIRSAVREILLSEADFRLSGGAVGSATADLSEKSNLDLMAEAELQIDPANPAVSQNLQNIVKLNDIVWSLMMEAGNKSAWETLAEKLLENPAFGGWEVATGSSAVDGGSQTVTTFYDVVKGSVYASVKSSFKGSSKSYRSAITSSSIKIQAILAFILDQGGVDAGIQLGNIGVYAERGDKSVTVHWGHVTEPIAAGAVLENIRGVLRRLDDGGPIAESAEMAAAAVAADIPGSGERESILDDLLGIGAPTGRPSSRHANIEKIAKFFQEAGLADGKGRMGARVTAVLGPFSDTPIAALTVYDPEHLFNKVMVPIMQAGRSGVDPAPPEERQRMLGKIKSVARGMTSGELRQLVDLAQDILGIVVESKNHRRNTVMKVTKSQLRKIIKEEKQKLLNETVADMRIYQDMIGKGAEDFAYTTAEKFAQQFANDMSGMFIEEPEIFSQSQEQWNAEVDYAAEIIVDEISSLLAEPVRAAMQSVVESVIQKIETDLHNGDFASY